jgi:hypothetical protein
MPASLDRHHSALVAPDEQQYITSVTADGVPPSTLGNAAVTPVIQAAIRAAVK